MLISRVGSTIFRKGHSYQEYYSFDSCQFGPLRAYISVEDLRSDKTSVV